jgi:hypothetical protein
VFSSFLALVLMKELHDRPEAKGLKLEWADIIRDPDCLQEVETEQDQKRFVLHAQSQGDLWEGLSGRGSGIAPDATSG